jgi:beta-lactamase superfamily II metal-dependent hydrolase
MAKRQPAEDAAGLTIHLLDMGGEKFGDSIFCRRAGRTILIDGGHQGDWKGRNGFASIPDQLAAILQSQPPFSIDLLVVTHCHTDHIGCLPKLVEDHVLDVKQALVADEMLGFGHVNDPGGAIPPDSSVSRLTAVLREEDRSDLPDAELAAFIDEAVTLEQRYTKMLGLLKTAGVPIVRYGRDSHAAIETAFADFGFQVLGPTRAHLKICADSLAVISDEATLWVQQHGGDTDSSSIAAAYRAILRQSDSVSAFAVDQPGKGAALNDQSIVIKLKVGSATALLPGDMQFVAPEISQLATPMRTLRDKVTAAGPYSFIKTAHHTSYNGLDAALLAAWSATRHFAHSGGINDATHPDPGVLQLLKDNSAHLQYARTDRNGLITVTFSGAVATMTKSRGQLDDFTPNGDTGAGPAPLSPACGGQPLVTARRLGGSTEVSGRAVIAPDVSSITMTFDVRRDGRTGTSSIGQPDPRGEAGSATPRRLGGGRQLPNLLFVTYRPRLANNVGAEEAAARLQLIVDAGKKLLEVRNPNSPYAEIREELARGYEGVVIVGGYDVLPAQRLDVLPPSLRQQLGQNTADLDNFIVWNDEAYADRDGDMQPEVPVSRIPDAKSPNLLLAALTAGGDSAAAARFGLRNAMRPFAVAPFNAIAGQAPILVSEPANPETVGTGNATGAAVYFMLHGSDIDATRYWGENETGLIDGVNLTNIPRALAGVVFTGCCYGALTVMTTAARSVPGQPIGVRTPGSSIALSYLHGGARAYVGCTGTHYSPSSRPYNYFGGPMHTAFLTRLSAGIPPARALFESKLEYLQHLPHGQSSATGQGIELKILKQFTCLGLGW